MSVRKLEELKRMIEEYRQCLQKELSCGEKSYDADKVLRLSCDLDELIVEYEQALIDNEDK